jgi:hypothetical protein
MNCLVRQESAAGYMLRWGDTMLRPRSVGKEADN